MLVTSVVLISMGVRQGSRTSCLLFTLFVDELIKIIKRGCSPDGFLQWLHILVLMGDTVLMPTIRYNIMKKISFLQDYCSEYGMVINQSKTKFLVINGEEGDKEAVARNGMVVKHCGTYVYLGSPFTSDGSVSSATRPHARLKMPHVLRFVAFINKTNDVPFIVKKRVFDDALMSFILYGCEFWTGGDLKPMMTLYN